MVAVNDGGRKSKSKTTVDHIIIAVLDESVGRCALLRVPRPLRGLLLYPVAKRITRLIRCGRCGAGKGETKGSRSSIGELSGVLLGAKHLSVKRSGAVIGLCDRALGCEARADSRWRADFS